MTSFEITPLRLHNQHLTEATLIEPDDVVEWLGAVQAQEYAMAKWGLAQRMRTVTDRVIEQAFTAGKILRTHVLRPTWHFVTPADIRWIVELTAPRVNAVNSHMYRKLELDDTVFKRSNAALVKALKGGKQLTREEIRIVFERAGIPSPVGFRFGYLMMRAELDRIVCSGARRGKQFTYALLDERAQQSKTLKRDQALCELTKRYFMSRGPATLQDFVWWSGLTMSDAKQGIEMAKSNFVKEVLENQTYWFTASRASDRAKSLTAYLLPIYDEYPLSYKDRSAAIDQQLAKKNSNPGVAFTHALLINGQIMGHWKRTLKKDSVVIHLYPFTPFSKVEKRAVDRAAHRYSEFLELHVVLK